MASELDGATGDAGGQRLQGRGSARRVSVVSASQRQEAEKQIRALFDQVYCTHYTLTIHSLYTHYTLTIHSSTSTLRERQPVAPIN
jgi:hypothetical protein